MWVYGDERTETERRLAELAGEIRAGEGRRRRQLAAWPVLLGLFVIDLATPGLGLRPRLTLLVALGLAVTALGVAWGNTRHLLRQARWERDTLRQRRELQG
jgi:hypothetical protein